MQRNRGLSPWIETRKLDTLFEKENECVRTEEATELHTGVQALGAGPDGGYAEHRWPGSGTGAGAQAAVLLARQACGWRGGESSSRRAPLGRGSAEGDQPGEPAAHTVADAQQRIAELERKIGRQQLEVDFFRAALQQVRGRRRSNGAPGAKASTP
jgi:hypothetical protein